MIELCLPLLQKSIKNVIGKKLTNRLGDALANDEIDEEGAADAIDMILPAFDELQTKEDLHAFLNTLASAYPFFGEIVFDELQSTKTIDDIASKFEERNVTRVGTGRP